MVPLKVRDYVTHNTKDCGEPDHNRDDLSKLLSILLYVVVNLGESQEFEANV
jgi:hypothetical protein